MAKGVQTITNYFPEIDKETIDKFITLDILYNDWNSKINVISRKDIKNIFIHHFLHSLAFVKIQSLNEDTSILDIGTGGGLPGIPLAIMFPKATFHLIDGTGKKIKVAKELIKQLELKNITAEQCRSEDHNQKYDIVLGRAVSTLSDFTRIAKKNLKRQGNIFYWTGGNYKSIRNNRNVKIFKLEDFFNEEYFIDKYIVKTE